MRSLACKIPGSPGRPLLLIYPLRARRRPRRVRGSSVSRPVCVMLMSLGLCVAVCMCFLSSDQGRGSPGVYWSGRPFFELFFRIVFWKVLGPFWHRFWMTFWIRRTPPGSRVSNYLEVNPLSPLWSPLPPATPQKSNQNPRKSAEIRGFNFFFASNFCINFLIPFFADIFRFWSDFGSHFGSAAPLRGRACQTMVDVC